ncbi:MAG: hypothetical protein ACREVE_05970 [Gammaproteobacteria bacterium]
MSKTDDTDWDNIDWEAMDEEEFAVKMLERVTAEPATLTEEQEERIEKVAQRDAITRRCVLAMLTKPGKHTLESALNDREAAVAYAGLQADIRDYLKNRHDGLKEFFEAVDIRIGLALAQREDMTEIIEQAKREASEAPLWR